MQTHCKSRPEQTVLISTYWNVNANAVVYCDIPYSFNLNLLECKYSFDVEPFSSAVTVLISTYWNVNSAHFKFAKEHPNEF